jgi:dTDP-4-dehydrorhamnose reductase
VRLLITGGTGFLGGELVAAAGAAGLDVVATYHHRPPAGGGRVRWLPLELRDPDSVTDVMGEVRPDAVVHAAYAATGDASLATAEGTGAVAAAAIEHGAFVVHVSSDVVFDGRSARPYTEQDPPRPIFAYGREKWAAEQAVAKASACRPSTAVIVRTSLIYRGPGDEPPSKHEQVVLDALDGANDFEFFVNERRNPVQVGDLARALLELAERQHVAGVLHVAGPQTVSRHEFACLVATAAGRSPDSLRAGVSTGDTRPLHVALDTGRACRELRTPVRGVADVFSSPVGR